MEKKYVSYLRVSTDKQGKSGLGLEAQKEAIESFLRQRGGKIVSEHVEIESGKKNDRPELQRALEECIKYNAVLVIAKLDRLARNVAFISNLMESNVEFVAVDFPEANRLTIHVLAAVAEHEREMISKRTKAALTAAKARGVKLGNNNLTDEGGKTGREKALKKRQQKADEFARMIYPSIKAHLIAGSNLLAISRHFNEIGIKAPRNGKWTATTVKNVLNRIRVKQYAWT